MTRRGLFFEGVGAWAMGLDVIGHDEVDSGDRDRLGGHFE
jgi:hypothetical protein